MNIKYVDRHENLGQFVRVLDDTVYVMKNSIGNSVLIYNEILENDVDFLKIKCTYMSLLDAPQCNETVIYIVSSGEIRKQHVESDDWTYECMKYAANFGFTKHPYNTLAHHILPDSDYIGKYIWITDNGITFIKVEEKWIPIYHLAPIELMLPQEALEEFELYKRLVLEANPT